MQTLPFLVFHNFSGEQFVATVTGANLQDAVSQVAQKLSDRKYRDVQIEGDTIYFFAYYHKDTPQILSATSDPIENFPLEEQRLGCQSYTIADALSYAF